MEKSLSVEHKILLACARGRFDAEVQAAVVALLDQGVDWEVLLGSARCHGLLPLLYDRFSTLSTAATPQPVMARLRSAYYTSFLRNHRLDADLDEVVAALRQEGVETMVLKGAALCRTVYSDPAQRPMVDLDLLVRREQMGHVGDILHHLGFRLQDSHLAHMVPFQQQFGGGLHWLRSRGDATTNLDVQYHLVKDEWCRASFPFEPEALWTAARPLPLIQAHAWQLSAEDALIYLCLHLGLNHGYACPVLSFADLDRQVMAQDVGGSWPRLIERARRFGVKTAVYRGLQCAQRLLGTSVPPEVLVALRPGALHLGILQTLVPLDGEAVLQETERQRGVVKQVLIFAALADHLWAVGSMIQHLLLPGEDWLSARYALKTKSQVRLCRLFYPFYVGWVGLQGLRRWLIESIHV